MLRFFIALFIILGIQTKAQFSILPHHIGVSYYGEMITHPGGKISLMYSLDHWNKVKKSKRGLAKTRIKDLNLNFNLGGFYHDRYQTGYFLIPEIEYTQSGKKGWYWGIGLGLGYLYTSVPNTYEVQANGDVKSINANNHYAKGSFSFTFGRDLYISHKKRIKFFVKPQLAMALPSYPILTGYFFLEMGLAYKLRYL